MDQTPVNQLEIPKFKTEMDASFTI